MRLIPQSMAGQMIAILSLSFALLLAALAALEILDQKSVIEWAESDFTLNRLKRMKPVLDSIQPDQLAPFLETTSLCHEGYSVTDRPYPALSLSQESSAIGHRIAQNLALAETDVQVVQTLLRWGDFSYSKCDPSEINLPAEGIVISLHLQSGQWLNAEVHPHKWHIDPGMVGWMVRSTGVFLLVGGIAIFFIHLLGRPLGKLSGAAQRFGAGLQASPLPESGPADLRKTIRSFNAMQKQVAEEVQRRAHTLAAISHDIRTPLTALRIKAEMIEDESTRQDLIISIEKMEKITASALGFLKEQSQTETRQEIDLNSLLNNECYDFQEMGHSAQFGEKKTVYIQGYPNSLARAVRNLIENAVKYGGAATVAVRTHNGYVDIEVLDTGPGIPRAQIEQAMKPFERLSAARESELGGFGLGLTTAKTIAEAHNGELILKQNEPTGLLAIIRLPAGE